MSQANPVLSGSSVLAMVPLYGSNTDLPLPAFNTEHFMAFMYFTVRCECSFNVLGIACFSHSVNFT